MLSVISNLQWYIPFYYFLLFSFFTYLYHLLSIIAIFYPNSVFWSTLWYVTTCTKWFSFLLVTSKYQIIIKLSNILLPMQLCVGFDNTKQKKKKWVEMVLCQNNNSTGGNVLPSDEFYSPCWHEMTECLHSCLRIKLRFSINLQMQNERADFLTEVKRMYVKINFLCIYIHFIFVSYDESFCWRKESVIDKLLFLWDLTR